MAFKATPDDIRANREYFEDKLRAVEQKQSVINWVKKEGGHEIVLIDARARDAFSKVEAAPAASATGTIARPRASRRRR